MYARKRRPAERLCTPPDLILEVVSPSSKPLDLITKREAYERFGVREYWTIDGDDGRVHVWVLEGGRYREVLPAEDELASAAVGGFVLGRVPIQAFVREAQRRR